MAKNKTPKIMTKKHLARQERERRQTRLITGIAIGVIAIMALGITFGLLWYSQSSPILNLRPAVTVNGETSSLHEFQARVKVTRQQLIGQYMQYMQLAQMFGMDPSSDTQMSQALSDITTQLDTPSTIGQQVIDDMVNDLLIRQYAKANGITVTSDEVEKNAQEALRYYPNGTPTATLTPTTLVYPTLDATQLALITPTPTPTPAPTDTPAPSATPRPTNTPDLTSTATPIPSITPTATPYTIKGYEEQYKTALKTYSSLGLNDSEFRYIFFESGLYRDRVQAKVTADIKHEQEQVWARHILVTDEAAANVISEQLAKGTDFTGLAKMLSIDTGSKDKGGDLGWFGRGKMVAEFEAAAFSMKVGEISKPIKTTYGYHIIQVLGHEVRPLTDTEYNDAVTAAFTAWLTEQRANSNVVINEAWKNHIPTLPTLAQAQANEAATATSYVATAQAKSGSK